MPHTEGSVLHSKHQGIHLKLLGYIIPGLFDTDGLQFWSSLFRYLVLSSELSVPYHTAIDGWLHANRDTYSREKLAPVRRIRDHLVEGMPMFQYLREKRRGFPGVVQNFLRLIPDEQSVPRFLIIATTMIQDRLQRNEVLKKIIGYPLIVLAIVSMIITVYRWKVEPTFSAFLAAFGKHLPLSIRVQDFVSTYFNVALALLIMLAAVSLLLFKLARLQLELVLFRIPVIGTWILFNERWRVLSALTAMSSSGIPWGAVVDRISGSLMTQRCRQQWVLFVENLRNGERWERAVERLEFLSPDIQYVLRQLPRVSGEIHPLLETTRDYYDVKRREISRLSLRAIEPVLVLLLGLWVGYVVYSMYRPLNMIVPLLP